MAAPGKNLKKKKNLPVEAPPPADQVESAKQLTVIQRHCAMLLGQGYTVGQVAERMVDYIVQTSRSTPEKKKKQARTRIRKWRQRQDFRDLVYECTLERLDNETPQMLAGILRKAKAGRVDAAKLVLELTQRHVPRGEPVIPNVQVIFEGVPRPPAIGPADDDVVDGEVVDDEEDED